jgi:DNA-3-methyladenine glycosylase II
MDPMKTASLSDEDTKIIGLSRQKASYIRDLAIHFSNNPGVYDHLETLSDDEIIEELTEIKGIGTWTAQMFLMFTLARSDVFAPDDAGLQRAMRLLYGWDNLPHKKELVEVAEKWRPYRTYACLHLWQSLDNNPTS